MEEIGFEGVDNVRDLGGIAVAGGRSVTPGLFFRGGALAKATARDREKLAGELDVTCVIDLRCGWERDEKPDVGIPGVENLHIPFYDQEKVGVEYTEPAEGTKVVGRDVACEPGRFYRSLSNELTVRQMRQGLHEAFARGSRGHAVYVHCSGGKDRAGVFALLLLTVLGAQRDAILEDYLFTNVSRDRNYEENLARFLRLSNGDEARARELVDAHRALPENIAAFSDAIAQRYGTMEDFMLNQLGFDEERRLALRAACTRPV